MRAGVEVVDVAPSVLAHHRVARQARWGLDGLPTTQVRDDAFDALAPVLRGAVDEAATLPRGWTRATPDGWLVDNRAMPAGGVTEWRGWSFTTDAFWTGTDRGQGRETNVRSRKVFAVADTDEWSDRAHAPGRFDSTLISPARSVAGRSVATVRFTTTYAVDGPQTAQVLVAFDGGARRVVRTLTAPVNGTLQVAVPVPPGARTVRAMFRCTGDNSAFWTLDAVTVTTR